MVKIKFWLMPNGDFDTYSILEKEIAVFEKWHSSIKIVPTIIPWSHMWDRLMNAHKQNGELNAPDVIQIGTTWCSTLNYLGVLMDITPFFERKDLDDVIPQLKESAYSPDKNLIAFPWFADIRMLYYRKDVLKKHGFSKKDLKSFESFKNLCLEMEKRRKDDKIFPYRLSGNSELILIHDLAPWLWGFGENFLTKNLKKAAFGSKKAKKAIKWYFDLINELYGNEYYYKLYGLAPTGNFFSGRYAMEIIGKSPLYNLSNLKYSNYSEEVAKNYGVAVLPEGPKGSFPFIGGSSLAIPRWCKNPEESAEWIKFLVSSESQLRHGYRIGVFPSKVSLLKEYFKGAEKDYKVVMETLEKGKTLENTPLLGTLEMVINAFAERILKAIRFGQYNESFLYNEINISAEEVNYIFSIYG